MEAGRLRPHGITASPSEGEVPDCGKDRYMKTASFYLKEVFKNLLFLSFLYTLYLGVSALYYLPHYAAFTA